jgi:hypothetical protein
MKYYHKLGRPENSKKDQPRSAISDVEVAI